jgi:phosphatidate cytidylyltransferase
MLRTRLWMGAVLIVLVTGVLLLDRPPVYPCLMALIMLLGLGASYEMVQLMAAHRLRMWPTVVAVEVVILANWGPALLSGDPWHWVSGVFAAVVVGAFLEEIALFRDAGGVVLRLALLVWTTAYLAVLVSFLIQLRPGENGAAAVALGIFVPKCCDIGAFFTGKFLGRHRMTPLLSPKKTWEGLGGGVIAAALTAVGINFFYPVIHGGVAIAALFGIAVGLAGVLGDLAESLIKRDCLAKDASHVVPGFGGVLDVVDAVLFGAPIAYLWLRWQR